MAGLGLAAAPAAADGVLTRPPALTAQPVVDLPATLQPAQDTTVTLRLTVDQAGDVVRVDVVNSAGEALDWIAMGAACALVFEPAEVDGAPAAVQLEYRYTFGGRPPAAPLPAVTASAPPHSTPPALPAAFTGRIVDDALGHGIPDVEVYVQANDGEALITTTDADGRFALEGVPPGARVVGLTATTYEQFSIVEEFRAGETLSGTYPLRRLGSGAFETVVRDRLRRAARVSMVAGSVSSVDEQKLLRAAPQSANEVLRSVPGVNVVDEEGIGLRPNVGFRGTDPNRSRKVLVLEDGAPIALQPYGEPELYYAPAIERMRRIDVAKGSDSILQGPQTIGGVLNYLSADPPRRLTVTTDVRAGTFGYWMGHFSAGDTLGPAGWRLDVVHRRFDGPRALGLQMVDVTGKVRLLPAPGHQLTLKVGAYDEYSNSTYLGLTTAQYRHDPSDNFARHDRFWVRRAAAQVNHEVLLIPSLRLQTIAYAFVIQRNWRRQEFDRQDVGLRYERVVTGAPGEPARPGDTLWFRDSNVHRNRRFTVGGVEPRFVFEKRWWFTEHQLIAGARLHFERAEEQRLDGATAAAASGALTEDEIRSGLALALYGQYRFTLFDTLRITPGLRLENLLADRHTLRTRVPSAGGLVAADVNNLEHSPVFAVIPGLGVSYLLWDGLMFFAGIHRGFAPPRTKDAITPSGENLRLEAERSWNMEAGSRLAVGDWLQAEVAAFHLDYQNQVVPPSEAGGATARLPGDTGPRLINGGRTRHTGVEAMVQFDLAALSGRSFRVPYTLTYTYVDARWVGGMFAGKLLPYAPQHSAGASVGFSHPLGFDGDVSLSYVSPQFTDNAATKLPSADGTVGVIGRRLLVDARIAWTLAPGLTFSVAGKNLADERYIASRAPQGIQPGAPRQIVFGVRARI
ncbi:MAG: TonB-dependent receptor [Deltaproteobacteria bacterium]|nr:TonB-dependent receptor [Deltaproteobacteria bacterium]